MDTQKRQKLIEKRKKEQNEREIRNNIAYNLYLKEKEQQIKSISEADQNWNFEAAIIFLGTLVPLYIFVFIPYWITHFIWGADLSKVGLLTGEFIPYLHTAIILISIISIWRRKSLLDSFFDYFSN